MKTSVFVATSLDGFIAREGGSIDWLGGASEDGEDFGFEKFFRSVDALVMGRNTFELVRTFGEWPYGSKPVFVLTSRKIDIPKDLAEHVNSVSGSPEEIVNVLYGIGIKHVYVDGGKTIQGFLRAGLVQRMNITRIPILIGRGIPLFGNLEQDISLQHIDTKVYSNGFVQSEYEVVASQERGSKHNFC